VPREAVPREAGDDDVGWFLRRIEQFTGDAVVFDGDTITYPDLVALIDRFRTHLAEHDVGAGDVVVLEGACSPTVCAGLLALVGLGAIVVPLTMLPEAKRSEFLAIAEAEVVVSVDGAGQVRTTRTDVRAEHELYQRLRGRGHPGLVLFSSGTTGRSKASLLDFAHALRRYRERRRAQRVLSFLNLDHIGGINTLMHTLSQGGTVITIADRTPDEVLGAVARHSVAVLPTTPTFLNMVLVSGAYRRHDLSSLRLVTYGTEPMPAQTLRRLNEELPGVRFKQTYGLSELGILPTRSRDNGSLWLQLGGDGFDHKIVDGILWIRSDMAMLGYLNAPAPFDADGYFNTQDAVEVDGDYVRILGRRSEIINVGGEKVYPQEVEDALLQVPNIAEATVSGKPNPVTGMVVHATVQLVEDEDERAVRSRIRSALRPRLEPFKVPAVVTVSKDAQHSDRFKKIRNGS
jgi:acyl-CoA synthetase (AMP-forming)/AMP-acid ligase II